MDQLSRRLAQAMHIVGAAGPSEILDTARSEERDVALI
jgi:hypothetical protein